jgi:hypothetical protein
MKTRRTFIAFVVFAVVGSIAYAFWPHRHSPTGESAAVVLRDPPSGVSSIPKMEAWPPPHNLPVLASSRSATKGASENSHPPPTTETLASLFVPAADHALPNPAQYMRQKFDAEPVDPSWSANVEANAKEYFSSQRSAQLVQTDMECHTTICQVLMAGNSPGTASESVEQYQKTVAMSATQGWWKDNGLTDATTIMGFGPDGSPIAVSYLTKKPLQVQPPIQY